MLTDPSKMKITAKTSATGLTVLRSTRSESWASFVVFSFSAEA